MAEYGDPRLDRPESFYPRLEQVTVYSIVVERMTGKEQRLPAVENRWPAVDNTRRRTPRRDVVAQASRSRRTGRTASRALPAWFRGPLGSIPSERMIRRTKQGSLRLRKKLHLAQFREFGFEVSFAFRPGLVRPNCSDEVLSPLRDLDKWIRRKLRCYHGKQWGRAGGREPRRRGVSVHEAWHTSESAHGPWRLSKTPALALAWTARYFSSLGLPCGSEVSVQCIEPPCT
jgi:hypothetical protein